MIDIWKRSELEKIMRTHGLRYSKGYGQNFLTDRNTLEKIVYGAEISPHDHVIEIGSGAGALTVALARKARRVTAVEIDGRLMPALREVTDGLPNTKLVNEDFLRFDIVSALYDEGCTGGAYKLVGNLPYYITTPIVAKVFESARGGANPVLPELAVFMMQKEVAERLVSLPGKKTYGAISVLTQYYAEAEILFEVSREVFVPRPGVDSAVVRLRPRDLSGDDPCIAAKMFRLVRAGFDMRRKTLRNSLARSGFSDDALHAALEEAGIDSGRRAETLSPRDFYVIAAAL